jgi:hypothetical protein
MNVRDYIERHEAEVERDEIVEHYGKDAYYRSGNRSHRRQPTSSSVRRRREQKKIDQQIEQEEKRFVEELQQSEEKFKASWNDSVQNDIISISAIKVEREVVDSWEELVDNELESIKVCQICLEDYEDAEQKVRLPCCRHEYHVKCLQGVHEDMEIEFTSPQRGGGGERYSRNVDCRKCPNCRNCFVLPVP